MECQRANKILKVVAALGQVHAWQEHKNESVTYNDLPQWIQVLTNVHIVWLDWPLHKVSTLISSNPRDVVQSMRHHSSILTQTVNLEEVCISCKLTHTIQ